MEREEAIRIAKEWTRQRLAVRRELIAAAREVNPIAAATYESAPRRLDNDVRKLWDYPSDLSEARLLALIEKGQDS
jgi:hypothetical protein